MKKIAYLIIGLLLLSLCSCANYVVPAQAVYSVTPAPYVTFPYPPCNYNYRPYCGGGWYSYGGYRGGCGGW